MIAANDRAGVWAAEAGPASQATFSRLFDLLSGEQNREGLETAPLELGPGDSPSYLLATGMTSVGNRVASQACCTSGFNSLFDDDYQVECLL